MKRSILMLEHDDDDRYITQAVFDEKGYSVSLHFVGSSDDLFAHLVTCEKRLAPMPALIMVSQQAAPRSTIEVIQTLKSDRRYSHIPVVVLAGLMNADFVRRCYEVGANSLIQKPSSGKEIYDRISSFVGYWFETVVLP